MKIQFCGGAQNVTGSQFLLTVGGSRVLLECGLFQGRRDESRQRNESFLYEPSTVNAALLTHAHMDHTGNVPTLIKRGYTGPVSATSATAELCAIMLKDSAYLQERDVHFVNKIRARQHLPPAEVLYTVEEAQSAMQAFVTRAYDETFEVVPGVTARFHDAGHILGSAGILLEIDEPGRGRRRLGLAVDIGRPNMPVLRDPNALRDLDVLLMECTYGNRTHGDFNTVREDLAQTLREVTQSGGKIIVPSFAVGRTQMLVYLLHELFDQNRIPEVPVFVDSPMALEATEIYRRHTEMLDRATYRTFLRDNQDPFGFRRLKYVRDVKESKELNELKYPAVIISSSGMCEGGRILHHLRNNIDNPKNMILFVGYSAKNTLGRRLADGAETVRIFGEEHRVRCRVKVMDGFSAHADRQVLLDYAAMTPPAKLKHIFLVHGEEDQALPLRDALRSKGYPSVEYPAQGETVEI